MTEIQRRAVMLAGGALVALAEGRDPHRILFAEALVRLGFEAEVAAAKIRSTEEATEMARKLVAAGAGVL